MTQYVLIGDEMTPYAMHALKASCFIAGLEAMQCALELEKEGYSQLLALHSIADTHEDYEVTTIQYTLLVYHLF